MTTLRSRTPIYILAAVEPLSAASKLLVVAGSTTPSSSTPPLIFANRKVTRPHRYSSVIILYLNLGSKTKLTQQSNLQFFLFFSPNHFRKHLIYNHIHGSDNKVALGNGLVIEESIIGEVAGFQHQNTGRRHPEHGANEVDMNMHVSHKKPKSM